MKWVIEENFENVANFLGELFDKTPKEINERFIDIPVMLVLKFIDDEEKILGTLVGIVGPTFYGWSPLYSRCLTCMQSASSYSCH